MEDTSWDTVEELIYKYDKLMGLNHKRRERLFGPDGLWQFPPPQTGQQIYKCNWRTNLRTGHSWIESMVQRDGTVIELRDGIIVELPAWPRPLPGDQRNWCLHCNSWHFTWWMADMIEGDWQRLPRVPTKAACLACHTHPRAT